MRFVNTILNLLRFNRRNWKAVTLCILAATVFWFLNALNKTYTTNLRFPLTFDYDQDNFVPVRALPKDIRLNVTGNGWTLFRRSTGVKIPPLEIPIERPGEIKKMAGSALQPMLANQLDGLNINYILIDTIFVDLEPKEGRWVTLRLDTAALKLKNGYGLASNISVIPDSIFIEGPNTVISRVEEPLRIEVPFRNIDEHFMEDVEVLFQSSEVIRRNPPTVAVMFDVKKIITVNDSVRLEIQNLPSGVWPVIGRKFVKLTFNVPENMIDQYRRDSVKAVLDAKRLARGERRVVPVIVGLPPFSTLVRTDSVSVKF